ETLDLEVVSAHPVEKVAGVEPDLRVARRRKPEAVGGPDDSPGRSQEDDEKNAPATSLGPRRARFLPKKIHGTGRMARAIRIRAASGRNRRAENFTPKPAANTRAATSARPGVTSRPSRQRACIRRSAGHARATSFLTRDAWPRKFGSRAKNARATIEAIGPASSQAQRAMRHPSATATSSIMNRDRTTTRSASTPGCSKSISAAQR